jgi:hypothetical protein
MNNRHNNHTRSERRLEYAELKQMIRQSRRLKVTNSLITEKKVNIRTNSNSELRSIPYESFRQDYSNTFQPITKIDFNNCGYLTKLLFFLAFLPIIGAEKLQEFEGHNSFHGNSSLLPPQYPVTSIPQTIEQIIPAAFVTSLLNTGKQTIYEPITCQNQPVNLDSSCLDLGNNDFALLSLESSGNDHQEIRFRLNRNDVSTNQRLDIDKNGLISNPILNLSNDQKQISAFWSIVSNGKVSITYQGFGLNGITLNKKVLLITIQDISNPGFAVATFDNNGLILALAGPDGNIFLQEFNSNLKPLSPLTLTIPYNRDQTQIIVNPNGIVSIFGEMNGQKYRQDLIRTNPSLPLEFSGGLVELFTPTSSISPRATSTIRSTNSPNTTPAPYATISPELTMSEIPTFRSTNSPSIAPVPSSSLAATISPEPSIPEISILSWLIGNIMLAPTIIITLANFSPNVKKYIKTIIRNNRSFVELQDVADIRSMEEIVINQERAEQLVETILNNPDTAFITNEKLKILQMMIIVRDNNSNSFKRFARDQEIYDKISGKINSFLTRAAANQQWDVNSVSFKSEKEGGVKEAVKLYNIVEALIMSKQSQPSFGITIIPNCFSALYVAGCGFSIIDSAHKIYAIWPNLKGHPELVLPFIESFVFSNIIANYKLVFPQVAILTTQGIEVIQSYIRSARQDQTDINQQSWLKCLLPYATISTCTMFGLTASIINLSFPFLASYTLFRRCEDAYGYDTELMEILKPALIPIGAILALSTIPPLAIINGKNAYDSLAKVSKICRNPIGFYADIKIKHDLIRFGFIIIGACRVYKLYSIIKEVGNSIFEQNEWPKAIVSNLSLGAAIASIPLTTNSMITTADRIYNSYHNKDYLTSTWQKSLLWALIICNAVANTTLAISKLLMTTEEKYTLGEKLREIFLDICVGLVSFAICSKYLPQPLSDEKIVEIKKLIKPQNDTARPPDTTPLLPKTGANRLVNCCTIL